MKILVRLPNALGDMVMSTAFITALYQQYPQAIVHVILRKELNEVVKLIPHPVVVHQFSKAEHNGLGGLYRFGKSLQKEKFDLLFCLPNSLSATLLCWATKATHRIGFYSTINFLLFTNSYHKPENVHRVYEYISLLVKYTDHRITNIKAELKAEDVPQQDLVLLSFNSEALSRKMPIEKGRSILKELTLHFPHHTFGLIGSGKEAAYVEQLIEGLSGNFKNYAGKTSIQSLATLMKSAKFMLSTDSGPAHLANSLGLPLLVLFGAGNEKNTAPFNKENLHVLRLGKLPCEPCVKNTCKYGSPKCLELLENNDIIQVLSAYLKH